MVVDKSYQLLVIDHLGPIVDAEGKRRLLLTVMDAFTRYLNIEIVDSTSAADTVAALRRGWQRPHRPPAVVLCDDAAGFMAAAFASALAAYGVRVVHTTPYNPTEKVALEQAHGSVRHAINTWMETQSGDLLSAVEVAVFSHNALPSRTVGESPAFLLTGVDEVAPGLRLGGTDGAEDRLPLLALVRDLVATRVAAERGGRAEAPDLEAVEAGNLVIGGEGRTHRPGLRRTASSARRRMQRLLADVPAELRQLGILSLEFDASSGGPRSADGLDGGSRRLKRRRVDAPVRWLPDFVQKARGVQPGATEVEPAEAARSGSWGGDVVSTAE